MTRGTLFTIALLLVAPASAAAQVCYSMPFTRIGDPWGCAASCGRTNPHRGVDFPAPTGTPIRAIASGVVHTLPYSGCLGNIVVIQHDDGLFSGYAHMRDSAAVGGGARVSRGDVIGYVGATGRYPDCVTGPHLHLTLGSSVSSISSGATIDPVVHIRANEAEVNCFDGAGVLLEQPVAYAPPTTTDLNGDGRADLCARASDGVHCWLAVDGGWEDTGSVLPFSDASGWNDVTNYATLRMGDVDGDGLADLCARSNTDILCARSTGSALGAYSVWLAGLSDASGWGAPEHYTTLRLADADGDGREDLCARDGTRFGCWLSDGESFSRRIDGPGWSNAAGFTRAEYYGTLRMGDLNGDGAADVCIRAAAGIRCALSDGEGFPTDVVGPEWSNDAGFAAAQYWSTLRMADVNGDGMEDLCIRTSTDLRCALSTGAGFGETLIVGALSNASGWADPTNYRTLRAGDVDGDGAVDLCARSDDDVLCWSWDGAEFVRRTGPAWADGSGWAATPAYFDTIRLVDVDGDGRDDICGRAGAGWTCHHARGDAFADPIGSALMADAQGWSGSPAYWTTILSGGRCMPSVEVCNGRDDDCDGVVDDGTCIDGGPPPIDEDAGHAPDAHLGADAGGRPSTVTGCGCRTGTGERTATAPALLLPLALLVLRRRSQRLR